MSRIEISTTTKNTTLFVLVCMRMFASILIPMDFKKKLNNMMFKHEHGTKSMVHIYLFSLVFLPFKVKTNCTKFPANN